LAKGLDGLNFIPSCLWFNAAAESGLGDDKHFLTLQMALLWTLEAKSIPVFTFNCSAGSVDWDWP